MSDPIPLDDAVPPLPTGGVVAEHRPCLACGYDLHGLSSRGVCPECGAQVERSLRGNLLEFANPEHTRTLHHGAITIEWGAFAPILAAVITIGVSALAQAGQTTAFVAGRGTEVLGAALSAVGASVALVGWYLFTRPDPGQIGTDAGEKARRWVRVVLIAEVVMTLAALVVAMIPGLSRTATQAVTPTGPGATPPLAAIIVASAVTILSAGVSAARAGLGAWYIATLAERVPDLALRQFARTMIWLLPVLATVGWIACGLGPLAAWILSIILIDKCRRQVRDVRARVDERRMLDEAITTHRSGA